MPPSTAVPHRSLAPREHGAYGQLFVPLVAALAMGRPSLGALGLGVAGSVVFFAHEPVLILLGQRGERARHIDGSRAKSRLRTLAAIGVLAAAAATSAPRAALVAAAAPLALGAAVGFLIIRGRERSAVGEIAAAAALASVAVPAALAAGVPLRSALGAWGSWIVSFSAATWAVRAVIAHRKARGAWPRRVLPLVVPAVAGVACALLGLAPWFCAAAAAPSLGLAFVVAAAPPPPRALRRIGWSLAAASVLGAAVLVIGGRLAA